MTFRNRQSNRIRGFGRLIQTFDIIATVCYNPSMARPKKGAELEAHERIALRITPSLRAKLDALAKANNWSLSDEIRAALERHAGRIKK